MNRFIEAYTYMVCAAAIVMLAVNFIRWLAF